jgi:hypothetical protein
MRSLSRLFPLLPALWLVACSGSGGESSSSSPSAANPVTDPAAQGFRMKTGKDGDDDEAKLLEKYASQSPFMTDSKGKALGEFKTAGEFDRANTQFDRGYAGKQYQAGEFKKKSWWGNQDYAKKVYGGDTDANDLHKVARQGGEAAGENVKVARDAGRAFDTAAYDTGAAREAGKDRIAKNSDVEAENRRKVGNAFSDPDIVPWQQQHGVTIEETKSKMGR